MGGWYPPRTTTGSGFSVTEREAENISEGDAVQSVTRVSLSSCLAAVTTCDLMDSWLQQRLGCRQEKGIRCELACLGKPQGAGEDGHAVAFLHFVGNLIVLSVAVFFLYWLTSCVYL